MITATIYSDDGNLREEFDAQDFFDDDIEELDVWKESLESSDWGGSEDTDRLAHAQEACDPQGDVARLLWYCGKRLCGFTVRIDKGEFMAFYSAKKSTTPP